jgi:RimJ/RimL family protein N-acetyltransferase
VTKRIFVNCEAELAPFMDRHCHAHGAFESGRGVALVDCDDDAKEAKIVAGVWFESWNGANMNIHVAAEPGARWMTKEFLWYVFHYAFEQVGAKRLTGLVSSDNHAARRFDEHIGFTLEATLADASPTGDLLVYVMRRESCRWLGIRKSGLPEMKGH